MSDEINMKPKSKRRRGVIIAVAVVTLLILGTVIYITLKDTPAKKTEKELEAIKNASVGDYITFGTYEQDNEKINGAEPIEWMVLEKKDGKALVLSKYALEEMPYHEESAEITWETCTLRSWLNDEFYTSAFNSEEQEAVVETLVKNNDNSDYGTEGGNDTMDKVFLLSIEEATTYFNPDMYAEDPLRSAKLTPRLAEYVKTREIYEKDGKGQWWLRSPGANAYCTALVYVDGHIKCYSASHIRVFVVRPALWIEY